MKETAPAEPHAPKSARRRPRRLRGGALLLFAAGIGILTAAVVAFEATRGPTTYSFVVPAGTGIRQDRGERVDILPAELRLQAGDHLVIKNEDDRIQSVGVFTVRPGEEVDQRFTRPGEFRGTCTLHGSGTIRIIVE